jgi:hypothetical protein
MAIYFYVTVKQFFRNCKCRVSSLSSLSISMHKLHPGFLQAISFPIFKTNDRQTDIKRIQFCFFRNSQQWVIRVSFRITKLVLQTRQDSLSSSSVVFITAVWLIVSGTVCVGKKTTFNFCSLMFYNAVRDSYLAML